MEIREAFGSGLQALHRRLRRARGDISEPRLYSCAWILPGVHVIDAEFWETVPFVGPREREASQSWPVHFPVGPDSPILRGNGVRYLGAQWPFRESTGCVDNGEEQRTDTYIFLFSLYTSLSLSKKLSWHG